MGLGPKHSSLLERCGMPMQVWRDPFAMQMEQQDRREARQEKARWHAAHRAMPKRPEAPVHSLPKTKGRDRLWHWDGESIPSKGIEQGQLYTAAELRKAGFKLPRLGKKVGKTNVEAG